MKFLVISDSHHLLLPMEHVLSMHRSDTDAVLFLGDGVREILILREHFPEIPIHAVYGNHDAGDFSPYGIFSELLVPAGDKTLYLCHGKDECTKNGRENLISIAKKKGADIALYGHLHIAREEYFPPDENDPTDRPMWAFNPGSIARPKDGDPSFGILELRDNGVLFSIGRLPMIPCERE